MDKEQAYKIGLAFKLGMIYAKGKAHARKLTTDKAEWITVHPNGKENKGRPALIDSTTGQVLGGMGGKFNGKHISIANSKSNKPALLNNQKMGFYDVEKEQEKTTTQYNAMQSKANLSMNEIISNSYVREDVTKGDTDQLRTTIESIENGENNTRIVTPKNIYEFKDNKWTDKDGNTVNKTLDSVIMEDFREFNKSSKYGSEEVKEKAESDTLLASGRSLDSKLAEKLDKKKEQAQELQKELDKSSGRTHSQRMGDTTRRNKLDKINNEIKEIETQLKDKAKQSDNKQPAENNSLINQKKDDLKKTYNLDDSQFNEIVNSENFKKYLDNKELVNETVRLNSAFARAYADTDLSKERAEQQKKYNEEQNKKIADYMKKENEKRFKESESVRESVTNTQVTMSDFQINKSSLLQNRVNDLIESDPTTQQLKLKDKKQETQLKDYQDQAEKNRRELLNHANSLRKYYQTNKDLLSDKQKEKIGERLNNLDDSIKTTENTLYRSRKVLGAIAEERQKAELKKEVNRKNKTNAFYDELTKHNTAGSSPDMYERDADSLRVFSETPDGAKIKTKTNGTFIKDGSFFVTNINGEKKSYTSEEFRSIIDSDKENKKSDLTTPKERTTRTRTQRTQNKTLSANKDNGSVASVLNVPDASKWNNKIYNYRNGEKAVFINDQRIVLNAEQYKKLKELAGK